IGTAEQVGVWADEASSSASAAASARSGAVAARDAAQSARDAAEGHANRADSSASNAATSETNAKTSETNAGDYAAVATTAATEAVDAMERATDLAGGDFATHEYVDGAVANALRVDDTAGTRVFADGQMIYGDTGLRKVEDLAIGFDFSAAAHHTMTIRRLGDEIILEGTGVRNASGTWLTDAMPLGFRPRALEYRGSRGFARTGSTLLPLGN